MGTGAQRETSECVLSWGVLDSECSRWTGAVFSVPGLPSESQAGQGPAQSGPTGTEICV